MSDNRLRSFDCWCSQAGLVGGDEGIIVNEIISSSRRDLSMIRRSFLSLVTTVASCLTPNWLEPWNSEGGRESSKLHPVVSVAVILPLVQPECLGWVQSSLSKGLTPRLTISVSLKDLGCRTELLGRYSISLYSEYLSVAIFISRYHNPEVYEVFIDLHIYWSQ